MRWLPAGSAAVVVALVLALKPLGPISRALAIACVVAAFLGAALFARKEMRAHASVVAGIAAVTAAGQVDGGWPYGVAVAAFFAAAITSLRAARTTDAPRTIAIRLPVAKIFVVTGAIVTAAVLLLPPIAVRVERFVTGMMGLDGDETTAFSTTMRLGATRGMLQSDAIVLRMEGAHGVTYLRGAVYDTFNGSQWITSAEGRVRKWVRVTGAPSAHVTLDRHAPTGVDLRWFLPPGTCNFDLEVEVDSFGIARRAGGPVPARLGFASATESGCTPAPIHAPTARDLEVDDRVRHVLAPLARGAIGDAVTPHDKLRALSTSAFRGFEYSLSVPRHDWLDPIVDFMTAHRAGHCEMFASAMVMLARTQGIPARVVGGYRVTEVNPITGQSVVRDRNAHAWVEAWYDGAWHAFDPTPVTDGPGRGAGFLDHAGDLWGLALDRLAEIGPLAYAAVLGVILVVLLAIRTLTRWVRRPRARRAAREMERPLPCFEALSAALAAAGFTRDPAETIEAFAARVPKEAAAALIDYAALRYGGIGDEADVTKRVEAAARARLTASSSS